MTNDIKKWYVSTPFNGKTPEQIVAAIEAGKDFIINSLVGEPVHSYSPATAYAATDKAGKVRDSLPIQMLGLAIAPLDGCEGIVTVGEWEDIQRSRGCRAELAIARIYQKKVININQNRSKL